MGRWVRRASAGLAVATLVAACGGGGQTTTDDGAAPAGGEDGDAAAPAEDVEGMQEAEALVGEYPREETLFTSGTQWGPPSSWNPIPESGEATGVRGALYEPLFIFDPHTVELEPWLAESGEWTSEDVYELTLRDGLTWQDGESLTVDDVLFTVGMGQETETVGTANLWNWLESAEATGEQTIEFTFSDPRYQEWDNFLYGTMIVPEHIVGEWAPEEYVANANEDPIGSGAFRYSSHGADRMVWERNDDWWGIEALGLEMPMRYIVDIVNPSNEVALGLLLQNGLDLSNNFLPGITQLVERGQVETYFDEPPYMLSANTAMLVANTTQEPTDDAEFRRALAFSIDVDRIVNGAYGNIVQAAHPSGLLPVFSDYYDEQVAQEHGHSYDPEQAQQILADAGYEDSDGDGFVETPGGDAIELSLIVPAGWTDWMEAARVIAESAQASGINVVAEFPDAGALDDARTTGDFDLVINNWTTLSNTPWSYYNYLFYQPITEQMFSGNFGRYENDEAWDLVQELSRTETGTPEFQETLSQLQELSLTEMPMIPLWYNGLWAQYNPVQWTNWPTDGGDNDIYPSTWGGFWEFGTVEMLAQLEPAN
ncbi:ABC transporter substrate-binding protein [Egicoccus halophilus]|uniref:ABC transporter substrate-binding protein n=1 Tax=Egicoccus halophilus TaxID=1670830 RepID=A0A8J3A9U8_9ACTN|nr:ABC transporter substrate-binding protein [Egicoccus halophilus]GGI07944.1 ABC transporter substrate-binding protein [Egicoccus halophilus]